MDLKIELAAFEGRLACLRAAARWQVSRDERRLILEPGAGFCAGSGRNRTEQFYQSNQSKKDHVARATK